MLKVENADVFYGRTQALFDINIELSKGIYGLIGENGAGKTTFINLIAGLIKQQKGRVQWNGCDIKKLGRKYYDNIGYLPQFPVLYGDFYPEEFLYYMSALKGINRRVYMSRTEELLEMVGLSNEKKKKISAFSGGMRQRLGIAQAMVNEPRMLIFDEPTAGLDPRERIRFRNLITEISKDRIVLLATHIISDVENIADEIIFLSKGRVIRRSDAQSMISEIQSEVYEASVDAEQYEKLDKRLLSNVANEDDRYRVRGFIDENIEKKNVQPNLEDAFLYQMSKEYERNVDDKRRI